MTYTPYFFRRNRDLGTISVHVGYFYIRCLPYIFIYTLSFMLYPRINTPYPQGVIIIQPKTSFLVVVFDGDHGFEVPRDHQKLTLIP